MLWTLKPIFGGGWRGDEIPMSRKISQVFQPDIKLIHIYDFGTSSETLVGMHQGTPLTKKPIYLMARNNMPVVLCMECNQPATWLCIECEIEDEMLGMLCDKHAEAHPHETATVSRWPLSIHPELVCVATRGRPIHPTNAKLPYCQ